MSVPSAAIISVFLYLSKRVMNLHTRLIRIRIASYKLISSLLFYELAKFSDEILISYLCERQDSGRTHNFRHNKNQTLHPGEDVCDKQWRHSAEPG